MLHRRGVTCLAVIGSLLLGVTGCGGGVPTTGETLKERPDNSVKQKTMLEGYMNKVGIKKGRAEVKKSGP